MTAIATFDALQREYPKARLARHCVEVACSPKTFYDVVSDYEAYPDFVPSQRAARVVSHEQHGHTERFTVSMELALVKPVRYTLRSEGVPGKFLTWSLLDGDFMRENTGSWVIEELPNGMTRATFQLAVVLKGWWPKPLINSLVNKTCPATVRAFKIEAERRARC